MLLRQIALCSLLISFAAAAHFVASPKGFWAQAFSDGGYAVSGDPEVLWRNPAGLISPTGMSSAVGFNNLTSGFYPYAVFLHAPQEKITYALGFSWDAADTLSHRQITGGFSTELFPHILLGSTVVTQAVDGEVGLDLHVGFLWQTFSWLHTAGAVEYVTESPVGDIDNDMMGSRVWHGAVQIKPVPYISANYDYNLPANTTISASHGLGLELALSRNQLVSIYPSIRVPQDSMEKAILGIGMMMKGKWDGRSLGFRYGLTGIAMGDFEQDVVHSLSFFGSLGYQVDKKKPYVWVMTRTGMMQHTAQLSQPFLDFELEARDDVSGIASWRLVICGTSTNTEPTEIIRTYTGRGLPPRTIRFDGRSSSGDLLPPGVYTYRLIATDKASNEADTRWQLVEIRP